MDIIKHLILLTGIMYCASCANLKSTTSEIAVSPINTIKFDVNYYNNNNLMQNVSKGKDIAIYFAPIPGSLFGNMLIKHAAILHLNETETIEIPISDFDDYFNGFSSELDQTERTGTFKIKPNTTKIIRVGTRATLQNSKKGLGGTGFLDNHTKKSLMLVYFDRACHITGTFEEDGVKYNHDISIPKAGAYWVSAETADKNTIILRAMQNNESISFAIFATN